MPNINLPLINQQYSSDFTADAQTTASYIWNTYGQIIADAAASVGIDPSWVVAFMIIESGTGSGSVNPNALSPAGAMGLLQLEPVTAWQTLENQAAAFTPEQSAIASKYLPGYQKPGGFTGLKSTWLPQIQKALSNPEFNIWVGTMQLAQMFLYIIKKTGDLKMDQVVIAYNAGQGNYQKYIYTQNLSNSDTATIVASFPFQETDNYIIKLLGIGGSMIAAMNTNPLPPPAVAAQPLSPAGVGIGVDPVTGLTQISQ